MQMIPAMVLLGILSFAMALVWRRRMRCFTELFIFLAARFDPNTIDLSGRKSYSACMSHGWVMKNLMHGPHSRMSKALQDLASERTFEATLALGGMIGILPMIVVYLAFGSFAAVGGLFLLAILAFILLQAPANVTMSYALLSWLSEQDPFLLKSQDFAYAMVSSKTISRWFKILTGAAIASIVLAPWSDGMLELVVYGMAVFIALLFTQVFVPLAAHSAGLAFAVLFVLVVSVTVLLLVSPGIIYRVLSVRLDILTLDTKKDRDQCEEEPVEKEENTGNH
ncbi:MAG: hypothetical protein ACFE8Z_00375 [Candidatus Hermodarchaeota archaeon]